MKKNQFSNNIFKTIIFLEKIKNHEINDKYILNKGFTKYSKIIFSIIKQCLTNNNCEIINSNEIYLINNIIEEFNINLIIFEDYSKIYCSIYINKVGIIEFTYDILNIIISYQTDDKKEMSVTLKRNEKINIINCNTSNKKKITKKTTKYNFQDIIKIIKKEISEDKYSNILKFEEAYNNLEKNLLKLKN